MQVRLLGPVEIEVDGVTGAPTGGGERALLARLALNAGRVVSSDSLIDELWGDDLPSNPGNALQLRVSKLRRWLTQHGGDAAVLATRSPGYALDVDPAHVDALAVVEELAAARSTAAAGAIAVAVERYRAALARWRDEPLCDVSAAPWVDAEATRLTEIRLAALEDVLQLELDLGRERNVLDELDALVVSHPLRERFHAQRMLALYRSGRQADALAAYQELRRSLADELGIDPSPEVQELEGAILRQETELAATTRTAATTVAPDLPQRVASFRGRDADLRELVALLEDRRLVTCTGPGGTGKTTLAIEAARVAGERFTTGAWLVRLAGVDRDDVVSATAAALELPAVPLEDGETAVVRLCRQVGARSALIVLDNCEHVVDEAALLAAVVVARCPNVTILATSRELLQVPGEQRFAVTPLEVPAAGAPEAEVRGAASVELFSDRARALDRHFDPGTEDLEHIAQICRTLDGLPLAVELAAARTATLPVAAIAERLGDQLGLLTGGPRTVDERHRTLRAAIAWSYDLLDEHARTVLRRLAVFRSPWGLHDAAAVAADDAMSSAEVSDIVGDLVDRSLVSRAGDHRFRVLETIRQFAAAELLASGEATTIDARHLAHMSATAARADARLRTVDQVEWLEELRAVNDDLRAALAFAERTPEHRVEGLGLASSLSWFWYLGDYEEGRRHLDRFLADEDGPGSLLGYAHLARSTVERPNACIVHPSDVAAGAAADALGAFRAVDDPDGAALAELLLAVEGVRGVDTDGALERLERARRRFAEVGDRWALAMVDFVRMEIGMRLGEGPDAIAHGERAATQFARIGDLWGLSSVRGHQGGNLRFLGELDDAAASFRSAIDIARDVGLHNSVQLISSELGVLLAVLGRAEDAHRVLEEARRHARRYGYRGGVAAAHLGHGHLARWDGDDALAFREYEQATEIMGTSGSMFLYAEARSGAGFAAAAAGDLESAHAAQRDVADVARSMPDPRIIASALDVRASIEASADAEHAAELLGASAALRERSGRPADPLERREIERITAAASATAGDAAVAQASVRGRDAVARLVDEVVGVPA